MRARGELTSDVLPQSNQKPEQRRERGKILARCGEPWSRGGVAAPCESEERENLFWYRQHANNMVRLSTFETRIENRRRNAEAIEEDDPKNHCLGITRE